MSTSVETLRKYIEKIAKKVLNDESSKNVITGTIISSTLDGYEVQLINGSSTTTITAESLYSDKTYKKDDYVYLIGAESNRGENYGTKYFIFGLVEATNNTYQGLSDIERFVEETQELIISKSINSIDNMIIINANDSENTQDLFNIIRAGGSLLLSTYLTTEVQRISNNANSFGLKIKAKNNGILVKEFDFSHYDMVGKVFDLQNVKQTKLFKFNSDNNIDQLEISIYHNFDGLIQANGFILQAGTELTLPNNIAVSLENVNKKTFFKQNDNNQQVQIKAIVKNNNQQLETKMLKYYWFVKLPEGEENLYYHPLGGEGWRCLNEWSYAQTIKNGEIHNSGIKIYHTNSDTLTINYNQANIENWLPQYQNKIKCVVTYHVLQAESKALDIFNFKHEQYDIGLNIKNNVQMPLLYANETVTIEAKLNSKLVLPQDTNISYRWYILEDNSILTYLTKIGNDNIRVEYSSPTITLGWPERASSVDCYKMTRDMAHIYCEAIVNDEVIASSLSNANANLQKIKVWCKNVSNIQNKVEVKHYQAWIATIHNLSFTQQNIEHNIRIESGSQNYSNISSHIEYLPNNNLIIPVDLNNKTGQSALAFLQSDNPFKGLDSGTYYLYYSEAIKTVDINMANDNVLRFNDYTYPKILRYCHVQTNRNSTIVTDLLLDTNIQQLNIFNQLTNSGMAKGIYYTDSEYLLTTDNEPALAKLNTGQGYYKKIAINNYKAHYDLVVFIDGIDYFHQNEDGSYTKTTDVAPQKDMVYYTISNNEYKYVLREKNNNNYDIQDSIYSFKTGEEYYEQFGDNLYINADFIRSGHLEVSDGQNEVFSADIDTGAVKIGGFHVTADHLGDGEALNGDTSQHQIYLSPGENNDSFVFWAGRRKDGSTSDESRPFWIKKDGTVHATGLYIGADHVIDENNESILTAITALSENQSWFNINKNNIEIAAGKTLYLGSGTGSETGKGDLIIDTTPLKLSKENGNYTLTITGDVIMSSNDGSTTLGEMFNEIDQINKDFEEEFLKMNGIIAAKVNATNNGTSCQWSLTSDKFEVKAVKPGKTGGITVDASGLIVEGVINAKSGGSIAGFDIKEQYDSTTGTLIRGYLGHSITEPETPVFDDISVISGGVYFGTDGINLGGNFKVDKNGSVTIKKAYINIEEQDEKEPGVVNGINIAYNKLELKKKWDANDSWYKTSTIIPGEIILYSNLGGTWNAEIADRLAIDHYYIGSTSTDVQIYKGYCIWSNSGALNLSATENSFPAIPLEQSATIKLAYINGKPTINQYCQDGYLHGEWYVKNNVSITSDFNLKKDIEDLSESYSKLFDLLRPVRFKFKDGRSNRYHTGFIAQEIESSLSLANLDTKDFAGFVRDTEKKETGEINEICYIRYNEIISLCVMEIQKLKKELQNLKTN